MCYQLVYNSAATSPDLGREDLEGILVGAFKRKLLLGVTGLLIYRNGEFLQLLEGDYDVVQHLYHDIILHDEYHTAVGIACEEGVAQRSFARWSMGFVDASGMASPAASAPLDYLSGRLDERSLSGPASVGCNLLMNMYHHVCRVPATSQSTKSAVVVLD
jgi:Sensors of blue-light using FAD